MANSVVGPGDRYQSAENRRTGQQGRQIRASSTRTRESSTSAPSSAPSSALQFGELQISPGPNSSTIPVVASPVQNDRNADSEVCSASEKLSSSLQSGMIALVIGMTFLALIVVATLPVAVVPAALATILSVLKGSIAMTFLCGMSIAYNAHAVWSLVKSGLEFRSLKKTIVGRPVDASIVTTMKEGFAKGFGRTKKSFKMAALGSLSLAFGCALTAGVSIPLLVGSLTATVLFGTITLALYGVESLLNWYANKQAPA